MSKNKLIIAVILLLSLSLVGCNFYNLKDDGNSKHAALSKSSGEKSRIPEVKAKKILKNYFVSKLDKDDDIPNSFYIDGIVENKYHIQANYYENNDESKGRETFGWWYVDIYTGKIYTGNMEPCD